MIHGYKGKGPQKVWTPWGRSDSAAYLAEGLAIVSTPSHGGLRVSLGLLKKNSRRGSQWLIEHMATDTMGSYAFFEEDCAMAAVFYDCPEFVQFLPADRRDAMCDYGHMVIERHWPHYFQKGEQ